MHELVPSASLAGEVLLDGDDIYDARRRLVDARKHIGMVFQKPNPFPAMSIYDNVIAGLKPHRASRPTATTKDYLVERVAHQARGCGKRSRIASAPPAAGSPVASSSVCASRARSR